jgi:twinfilin-like protein
MSHSSGIPVSESLKDSFGSSLQTRSVRLFKVQIENEEIIEITQAPIRGDWESDLALLPGLLEKDKACYIIYRLDTDSPSFSLLCYVPDKAKVKEKMIYASSRSNLKQQLGANFFSDEVFGTVPDDFSVKGYKLHLASKRMEAPLTEQEQIKKNELESGEIYTGGASTYVHGVAFPVEQQATDAVKRLVSGNLRYVCIAINCDAERIVLDDSSNNLTFDGLKSKISTSEPRFHFLSYPHDFDGSKVTSLVYVYSCPDGSKGTKSAPVRMRMLYSSSKANVANIVTSVGGKLDARLEINVGEDLDEDEVLNQLHPQVEQKEAAFSRPQRAGKGGRKLIRSPKS